MCAIFDFSDFAQNTWKKIRFKFKLEIVDQNPAAGMAFFKKMFLMKLCKAKKINFPNFRENRKWKNFSTQNVPIHLILNFKVLEVENFPPM